MRKINILIVLVLALPAFAATAGDPIDGNDIEPTSHSVETACDLVEQYPGCGWCLDQCLLAYMMESYYSGGLRSWDWDF